MQYTGKDLKVLNLFSSLVRKFMGNVIIVHQYPHREQETGKREFFCLAGLYKKKIKWLEIEPL